MVSALAMRYRMVSAVAIFWSTSANVGPAAPETAPCQMIVTPTATAAHRSQRAPQRARAPVAAALRWGRVGWHLAPRSSVQQPAPVCVATVVFRGGIVRVRIVTEVAPLFEEERHTFREALVSEVSHPVNVCGTDLRTRFPADDDPIDFIEVQGAKRAQQRLKTEKPACCRRPLELTDPMNDLQVLDAGAKGDILAWYT